MSAVEVSGKKKSDFVWAVRVKHTADQTQSEDLQTGRLYSRSLCQRTVFLHGNSVSQQAGTAAVAAGIHMGGITAVFCQVIPDKVKSQMQIRQLVVEEAVRHQTVFDAEHHISRFTEESTKRTVEFLVSHKETATVDVDDDRESLPVPILGTVDIQTMCRNMLLVIENIRL